MNIDFDYIMNGDFDSVTRYVRSLGFTFQFTSKRFVDDDFSDFLITDSFYALDGERISRCCIIDLHADKVVCEFWKVF